jgi:SAM-dependent methyltransferase
VDILDFYDRHPISEEQVLAAVARRRGPGAGRLDVEDLFDFDQDHYGGLAAVDALADRALITGASRALDVGAGLGGPARFLASRRACRVVGLELNARRVEGGARLTRRVGLAGRVRLIRGDARRLPFANASFDACISQEVLLHIADKAAVLAGCCRVLRAGGRLAFTDWIAHPRLADRERDQLFEWMAVTTLQTLTSYPLLIGQAGFAWAEAEDLSAQWRVILRQRIDRYRRLRDDLAARMGAARYREYDQLFTFLVSLVDQGKLGSGRFWAGR